MTATAQLDRDIDQIRNDMRTLANTAETRRLTEDEIERWHDLVRSINRKMLQRDQVLVTAA